MAMAMATVLMCHNPARQRHGYECVSLAAD